MFEDFTQKERM